MNPIDRIVQAVGAVAGLGGRVYKGVVPAGAKGFPLAVIRRAGGATLATDFGGQGTPIPLISIQVVDSDYSRMDATMREVERQIERLTFSVYDPPDDDWHDVLNAHAQTITVAVVE